MSHTLKAYFRERGLPTDTPPSQQPEPPGKPSPSPGPSVSGESSDVKASSQPTNPASAPEMPKNPAASTVANVDVSKLIQGPPDLKPTPENLQDAAGRRVRLRFKPGAGIPGGIGSEDGIMAPLKNTSYGIVFPYQPTITYQQDVTYQSMEIVHANQDFHVYSRTPALKLQVEGEFTVQNQIEGKYALASIHFLRTVTKMSFGTVNQLDTGTPPPVLLFDAYGQYMFNSLPVIVTSFTIGLPKDVDYVPVNVMASDNANNPASKSAAEFDNINNTSLTGDGAGYAWLPAVFMITVQLTVQNTPARLRAFNLQEFRTGKLLTKGSWV